MLLHKMIIFVGMLLSIHVHASLESERNAMYSTTDDAWDAKMLISNLTGLTLGATSYAITSRLTDTISTQVAVSVSIGVIPPLIACSIWLYRRCKRI